MRADLGHLGSLLWALIITICFLSFASISGFAQSDPNCKLHPSEVEALRGIAKKLGHKGWYFGEDPCSGKGGWNVTDQEGFENFVKCAVAAHGSSSLNLSNSTASNGSTCHVVSIFLKSQNLSGTLPPELSKLRYLERLDLSRNILSGTVPHQWATLQLIEFHVMGSRLSGPFPEVLTNITTLRYLTLEANQFSGPIPPEIGRMINMETLHINSNNFTGELPVQLSKLVNMTDLRISDNNFSGKIPDFISKLTKLEKLHMQGCSLEGPIPSSISALTSLTDLWITDLIGGSSSFPPLSNMEHMKTLVLRNCLLSGKIPDYLNKMSGLKTLDLSFNNLTGEVPESLERLPNVESIYLTRNRLGGSVPPWILERSKNVDISYNNFTWGGSSLTDCSQGNGNLVESYSSSSTSNQSTINPCFRKNFPCSLSGKRYRYWLYINCGGQEKKVNNTIYETDVDSSDGSTYHSSQNWAFSSIGDNTEANNYILHTSSAISSPNSELYTSARRSAISLTYYGLCLGNGNYTVGLHFAEILFTNDSSYLSVGKRVFDVYVQDKLVLKDFNIKAEAGGPARPIVKRFIVDITNNTLKVHFYWAGRGTSGIPSRGNYGPLISAISVDPKLRGLLDQNTGLFSLRQIKAATKNFHPAKKLGEGGFGCVYKGELGDGTVIAVKQLSSKSKQGNREFVTELGMISGLQHPNLVKLHGCCVEGNQLILVYEYMENNCLSRALFDDPASRLKLDWPSRHKICLDIARGLAYLHDESRIRVVHRDIKASNVLLDKDLNAKISDFGLAKLHEEEDTHISTRVAGTIGYMAPEYAMRGCLTSKADVYSFGVVALEIVSGKSNTSYRPKEDYVHLLDWAFVLQERGCLLELIDPALGSDYSWGEVMLMMNVALLCANASPTLRPTMSQVVSMLEGRTAIQDFLSDPAYSASRAKYKAIRSLMKSDSFEY
ncbi:Probable LRR receptor-like serine/threonine-protein kinase At1g07650 [Linum perenne]